MLLGRLMEVLEALRLHSLFLPDAVELHIALLELSNVLLLLLLQLRTPLVQMLPLSLYQL